MKRFSILFFSFFIFSSCGINGITNDFDELSDSEKMMVTQLSSFNNLNNDLIYEISGSQLLEELKSKDKSLVYIFANGCSSNLQNYLDQIEYYAEEYGYNLYLVMSGFSRLEATTSQSLNSPLFAISAEQYETKKSRKYLNAFRKDLGYDDFVSEHGRHGAYMFFEGDSLVDLKYSLIP